MTEPYCLAMVLADGIHRDAGTGKFTILGTFNSIFPAQEYPISARFCVYFAITDGAGDIKIDLRIKNAAHDFTDDDELIFKLPEGLPPLSLLDPLMVCEGVLVVTCSFPSPGLYHCELYADESRLMSRRLILNPYQRGQNDG